MGKLILLILCFGILSADTPKKDGVNEDILIIDALLSEDDANYPRSQEIFLELYSKTKKLEYLIQASREAMMYSGSELRVINILKDYLRNHPETKDLTPARMVVALYAKMGDMRSAEEFAMEYLAKSRDVDDMRLIATIKSELKKYKEALKYLQKAYKISPTNKILLDEVNILKKLNRPKKAIKIIEHHIKKNSDASIALYFKLIEFYAKERNFEGVLKIYKKLYKKDPQKYFLQKIIKLSLYLKKFDELTKFLEKKKGYENLLYLIYKERNRFDKAIALAKRRFKETKKPKWLAEEAILMYEEGDKKGRISPKKLKEFQKIFDKALKLGAEDAMYLNYYGYVLIDHDLDVERGIKLVTRALKQEPTNTFYLDSLAWGLYKLGKCQEAYKIMKRVIAKEGILQESEIRMHWESIRECNRVIDNSEMF